MINIFGVLVMVFLTKTLLNLDKVNHQEFSGDTKQTEFSRIKEKLMLMLLSQMHSLVISDLLMLMEMV